MDPAIGVAPRLRQMPCRRRVLKRGYFLGDVLSVSWRNRNTNGSWRKEKLRILARVFMDWIQLVAWILPLSGTCHLQGSILRRQPLFML
ncbi:hypothetical protein NDU88_001862 [Pleurodeles waltl]|uniref:Uncharacterized protein n=1 Tax=Pleurodeles waltl TaxID=8319 RepID=A0AAV7Q8D0_PLEWA|nr:hypothetical protein NDU88_001862 [Pleurodeles waltl]